MYQSPFQSLVMSWEDLEQYQMMLCQTDGVICKDLFKIRSKPHRTEEYLEHRNHRAAILMLMLWVFFFPWTTQYSHTYLNWRHSNAYRKRQEPHYKNSPTPCTQNSPHEGQKAFVFFSISLESIQLAE